MTTNRPANATVIEIDKNVPLVRIVREFNAPNDKVFRAHADPVLFAQWNGPNDTMMTIGHYDFRTGRTRLTSTSLVDSFEDRDAFVASGMESGVVEGYERLDAILDLLGKS